VNTTESYLDNNNTMKLGFADRNVITLRFMVSHYIRFRYCEIIHQFVIYIQGKEITI